MEPPGRLNGQGAAVCRGLASLIFGESGERQALLQL